MVNKRIEIFAKKVAKRAGYKKTSTKVVDFRGDDKIVLKIDGISYFIRLIGYGAHNEVDWILCRADEDDIYGTRIMQGTDTI